MSPRYTICGHCTFTVLSQIEILHVIPHRDSPSFQINIRSLCPFPLSLSLNDPDDDTKETEGTPKNLNDQYFDEEGSLLSIGQSTS